MYRWASGYHPKIHAEIAAKELDRLAEPGVTPEAVVDCARPASAPLHPVFEWDDSIAAEEYRKEQARHMLGALVLVAESGQEVRAYVNVKVQVEDREPKERLYMSTSIALAAADLRQQVLQDALRQIEGWERRYKNYKEFAPIFASIETVRAKILVPDHTLVPA